MKNKKIIFILLIVILFSGLASIFIPRSIGKE